MAPRPCLHLHLQTCYPFSLISTPPLRFVIKKNRETSQSPEYLTQQIRQGPLSHLNISLN